MPLSSLRHPLPPLPLHHQSRLTRDRSTLSPINMRPLSCAHPGIARRDTKSRLNLKMILPYLGSSQITIRSLDLLGNLRTFLLWLRSLLGSLRIYFGSSLDLSDSSLILEIGLSSEIFRISRPFAHLSPLPPSPPLDPLPAPPRSLTGFLLIGLSIDACPLSSLIILFRLLVMTHYLPPS